MTRILLLDDDHVIRLARFALEGPGEVEEAWVRAYLSSSDATPAMVRDLAQGLDAADGVEVVPTGARSDPRARAEAEIILFRRGTLDAETLARYPRLRFVQRLGARTLGIDLAAAAARGIAVSCLPRPSLVHTAEHTILLMLALAKRLLECDAAVRRHRWDRERITPADGSAYNWARVERLGGLFGQTLGIIGLGEVGSIVAERGRAFGMTVLYTNRHRLDAAQEAALGVAYRPFPDLLREADFVALCAANLPENGGLMDRAAFARMKPGAFFVNTSRGRLVDEEALHRALAEGRIAGAGLDVHWQEPRPEPDPLSALENIILTPHCAAGVREAVLGELEALFANCRAFLAGRPVAHQVTP